MPKFSIKFSGHIASGKTVALLKVKKALEQDGYEVVHVPGNRGHMEHELLVSWESKT